MVRAIRFTIMVIVGMIVLGFSNQGETLSLEDTKQQTVISIKGGTYVN